MSESKDEEIGPEDKENGKPRKARKWLLPESLDCSPGRVQPMETPFSE